MAANLAAIQSQVACLRPFSFKIHRLEVEMQKYLWVALAAVVISGSSFQAHAQIPAPGAARDRMSATEQATLADARIAIVKAVLQLTPQQEKHWPAVEEAIRSRSAGRQARLASIAARVNELRDRNVIEILRDRNPVEFLRRRAEALSQRSAELRRLADAWQPLFDTLGADQRRRLGIVAVIAYREMRDAIEERLMQEGDDEEWVVEVR